MHWKQVPKSYDYLLALAVIALGVFGVVMIYASANAELIPRMIVNSDGGLWRRQRMFIISGAVLMVAFSMIDYHFITRFYVYIYGLMLLLLVVVMIIGADDHTGVARWIWIPVPFIGFLSMQPSEFAKIFMTIFMAKFLDVFKDRFNRPLLLVPLAILIIVPVLLVFMQPSFSASMVVLSISLVVLFVGGLYWRTILVSAAVIAPVGIVVWFDLQRQTPIILTRFLSEWQWRRIESFLRPEMADQWARYQTERSLYAIGTGGLTGRGFLENPYIILGHNDFVFSVAATQFGFVGAVTLLGVVAFVIVRCIRIALKAVDTEGKLIAAGVAGMLIFETFFHVGVATDLLPNTGMPFPFLSYGGSMIWVHMIAIGMVLNVGLPRKPKSMFDQPETEEDK
ncbi:MAG: FtsW/RodA/SpoVE family cell cycle protein [Defluviitaleaceae bacterium]|nr:FtsW/RodA/SpoVE family cell cycle protein [Defluviitaleaceae bacterium]MCL2262890.1 FtsW/RodA/SpoVE family cell cycle protein [Defluviitaleaceae bacterium]